MGESTEQIEEQIVASRDELGRNLYELEVRAKELIDWRIQYRTHPGIALALAFGAALILGVLSAGGRRQY